jgi:ABC-type multidrug transport system ATPase subunit
VTTAIQVTGLAKSLAKSFDRTRALDGVDLIVPEGSIMGLLGPNGAGKTTLVGILATLLRPDAGTATVAGHDVTAEPQAVCAQIGLTGQYAAIDEDLTGRENLELVRRLSQLSSGQAPSAHASCSSGSGWPTPPVAPPGPTPAGWLAGSTSPRV